MSNFEQTQKASNSIKSSVISNTTINRKSAAASYKDVETYLALVGFQVDKIYFWGSVAVLQLKGGRDEESSKRT